MHGPQSGGSAFGACFGRNCRSMALEIEGLLQQERAGSPERQDALLDLLGMEVSGPSAETEAEELDELQPEAAGAGRPAVARAGASRVPNGAPAEAAGGALARDTAARREPGFSKDLVDT